MLFDTCTIPRLVMITTGLQTVTQEPLTMEAFTGILALPISPFFFFPWVVLILGARQALKSMALQRKPQRIFSFYRFCRCAILYGRCVWRKSCNQCPCRLGCSRCVWIRSHCPNDGVPLKDQQGTTADVQQYIMDVSVSDTVYF